MSDNDRDLEAVLARAYAAIAQPGSIVDLWDDLSKFENVQGAFGDSAEMHFSNAAEILDNAFPNDSVDHGILNTKATTRIDGDLVLDRTSRVVSANAAIFDQEPLAQGGMAPVWLFDPVTANSDKKRLSKLEAGQDSNFFRLFSGPKDENGRWYTARHDVLDAGEVVVFDAVRLRWSERSGKAFQDALRLTETEIALVRHMVAGGTVREFAEDRGRSLGTARNQLKALQRKLAINSKEELLLLYAGFLHSLELPLESRGVEQHICQRHFRSADGECIAWEEHGDPAGEPLLYFHPIEGALLTPEIANAARRLSLRIIAPWRPYYGETTAKKTGIEVAREFARRLPAFLDHVGVEKCTAITTHAGAPYMFAFAQNCPERVKAAVGIGSYFPVFDAAGFAAMRKTHRRQIRMVRIAPSFAKVYQRAMLATIGTGEFHRFVEEFYTGCDRELRAIQQPAMVHLLRTAATYVVRGKFMGTAETMVTWSVDWSALCKNIKVPVHMLYGRHDATIAASEAKRVCSHFGFLEPEFFSDAGSFLLQDKTSAVLGRVREIARENSPP